MCSSSLASLTAVTRTVWPALTLTVAPLGLTLPLATVMASVTSAWSPDGSVVVDGVEEFGLPGVGVFVGTSEGAVVGAVVGVLGVAPLPESFPQPARTNRARAGRRAVAVPRAIVERMGREAFQRVCSVLLRSAGRALLLDEHQTFSVPDSVAAHCRRVRLG